MTLVGACSVEGCPTVGRLKRGYCHRHYLKWWRTGDPEGSLRPSPESLFWKMVEVGSLLSEYAPHLGPCAVWTGSLNNRGYGHVNRENKELLCHRVAYELVIGPIPEGLELDHLCRVTTCVKAWADESGPAHLEAVTHLENVRRAVREVATHCQRGHPFDAANTYVRPDGRGRTCRTCRKASRLAWELRQ